MVQPGANWHLVLGAVLIKPLDTRAMPKKSRLQSQSAAAIYAGTTNPSNRGGPLAETGSPSMESTQKWGPEGATFVSPGRSPRCSTHLSIDVGGLRGFGDDGDCGRRDKEAKGVKGVTDAGTMGDR
jgi:hypothetical protein